MKNIEMEKVTKVTKANCLLFHWNKEKYILSLSVQLIGIQYIDIHSLYSTRDGQV